MENKVIGPALPPHLLNRVSCSEEVIVDLGKTQFDDKPSVADVVSESNENDIYGPALPPHLKKQSEALPQSKTLVGPCLPSETLENRENSPAYESSDGEDYNIVGPPVPGGSSELSLVQQKLEMRAQYLKRKMAEEGAGGKKRDVTERESWMLELPPERAVNLGLGPRSFRKREGPDMKDRSDWTDTPADRMRKQLLGQEGDNSKDNKEDVLKAAAISQRDKLMEKMAESCKDEKRELSLLEIHKKKMLKKQKKEKKKRGDKPPERRPFDRDIDLQANRFDEAQKKSIFKKAQLLDTRFSSGQSKYL